MRFLIRGNKDNPYHVSVGGILIIEKKVFLIKKKYGEVTLPRETMYSDESIESTLIKGMLEEVGMKVELEKYLGSLVINFNRLDGTAVEKTTLYFLTKHLGDAKRDPTEWESTDIILRLTIDEAIKELKRSSNPEHIILERLLA